jgi:glycine/sarcosine N-methyltransferase
MSDFYEKLAVHYDDIFPPEGDIVSFLASQLRGREVLLDLACGTGTYAEELARLGFSVTGVDLDASMIATAEAKQTTSRTKYFAADMIGGIPALRTGYDAAYCIGNSLPHLDSLDQAARALRAWHDALTPGGALVLQIVNFDRFAVNHETDLPSIERKGFVFERRYLPAPDGKVTFKTVLHAPGETQTYENAIDLLVIGKDTLSNLLAECGFETTDFFGGYSGQPHDKVGSFLTVCTATKPRE